jgi:hypothetical protein
MPDYSSSTVARALRNGMLKLPEKFRGSTYNDQPPGGQPTFPDRWGIGARRLGGLAGLVAALQVDDGARSAWAASSIRGEAQPWNIMPDWMCQ